MKKLIPILSLTVLSSCTNTTQLKANLVPNLQEMSPRQTDVSTVVPQKINVIKEITQNIAIQPRPHKISDKLSNVKQGIASWYGSQFHGKKTATGELFDMYGMTAAHNSLPIRSYAQITNIKNHRTVIVRINDRGAFYDRRVLDLSYSAAKQLGIDEAGKSKVEIESIAPEQALKQLRQQNQLVYLQVGSFSDKKMAQALKDSISKQHLPDATIATSSHKGSTLYKVKFPIHPSHNVHELDDKLAKLGITDTQFVTQTN